MDCIPALIAVSRCFRQIVSDKTLQVLRHWHERSRGRRRFAWGLEPVAAPGRVGFLWLWAHPRSSVAKSSGWRLAEAAGGRRGAAASAWCRGSGRPDRRGSVQTWSDGRERRGGSAMMRKILLYTAVWCDRDMFVHCFHCFPLLVSVDWYDYFRVFCFWDESSSHWNFVCLVFKVLDLAISSACWSCCVITGAKGIGACCTSVAASIAYFSILVQLCKLV